MHLYRSLFALALGMSLGTALIVRPPQPPAPAAAPSPRLTGERDPVLLGFDYACTRGDAHACVEVAERLASSTPRDVAEAQRLLERGCERGHGESCDALARRLDAPGLASWPQDRARALLYFVEGCERSFADACTEAGKHSLDGDIVTVDLDAALRSFERGCELGSPEACLFKLFTLNKEVERLDRAVEEEERSREADPGITRCSLTRKLRDIQFISVYRAALVALPRACKLGLQAACVDSRETRNKEIVRIAADTLCERGHLSTCTRAGKRDPFAPPADLITDVE